MCIRDRYIGVWGCGGVNASPTNHRADIFKDEAKGTAPTSYIIRILKYNTVPGSLISFSQDARGKAGKHARRASPCWHVDRGCPGEVFAAIWTGNLSRPPHKTHGIIRSREYPHMEATNSCACAQSVV